MGVSPGYAPTAAAAATVQAPASESEKALKAAAEAGKPVEVLGER
ncbi:hypothetical protein ACFV7Q_13115 [Streptomyces sp. NPDC059851]